MIIENKVYLLVLIYKYDIKRNQISQSIALSRDFRGWIKELYYRRSSTYEVWTGDNITMENKL